MFEIKSLIKSLFNIEKYNYTDYLPLSDFVPLINENSYIYMKILELELQMFKFKLKLEISWSLPVWNILRKKGFFSDLLYNLPDFYGYTNFTF